MRKPNKNKMAGVNSRFASALDSEILKMKEDAVLSHEKSPYESCHGPLLKAM